MVILKSHAAHVFRCMGINIIPGINTIENDQILTHVSVKMRLASGSLELLEGGEPKEKATKKGNSKAKKAPPKKGAPQPRKDPVDFFTGLEPNEAKKHIKEMFDVKFLEKYLTHETRQDIIDCIVKQIKLIREENEKGSDGGN